MLKFVFLNSDVSLPIDMRPSFEDRFTEGGVPFSTSRLRKKFGWFTAWKEEAGVRLTGVNPPELTAVKPDAGGGGSDGSSDSLRVALRVAEARMAGESSRKRGGGVSW